MKKYIKSDNSRVCISCVLSFSIAFLVLFSSIGAKAQTSINYGDNIQGATGAPSEIDIYTFDGTANDIITILVARSANIFYTPMIELYDPDGVRLRRIPGNTIRIDTMKLQKTGTYKIWILDDNGSTLR